jgi:hypothetical protein
VVYGSAGRVWSHQWDRDVPVVPGTELGGESQFSAHRRTACSHHFSSLSSFEFEFTRATLYQRLSLTFTKYRTDSLWSQSKALLKDGSRPPLPHQPPSCLCTACTTRFQQHSPTACHTPLSRNSSACCFRTTTRPRNSPNLSCRIARPLWSVPSRNSLTEGLALPQASASRPSSRLNALQTNHNHHF